MSDDCYSYLDDIDSVPTVALIGFKVLTYQETKTLSTTRSSVVITQFDDERSSSLKEWFIANKDEVFMNNESCNVLRKVAKKDFAELTTKQLIYSNTKCFLNVNTTLEDVNSQKFIYICCELCHYQTETPPNTLFYCQYCKVTKYARRRFRFQFVAKDSSGKLDITVFGEHGRKLFGITEDVFNQKYADRSKIPQDEINTILHRERWRLLIKPKLYQPNEKISIMYYNVDKWPSLMEDDTAKNFASIQTKPTDAVENRPMLSVDPSPKLLDDISVKIEQVEEAKSKAATKTRIEQELLNEKTDFIQVNDDEEQDQESEVEGSRKTRSKCKKRKAVN